jgi:peptidoglycan/LPS O-acetylase OafA/YrhL
MQLFLFLPINSLTLQNIKHKALYFPLLDTTRFVAFIPVFLTHCFISSNENIIEANWFKEITHFIDVGLLGLDYFFVLSSFLITRLIIDEKQKFQMFSFRLFFIRRCLRIWPLYFLIVAIGFVSYYSGLANTPLPSFISFASFTLNFYIVNHGFNFLFFLTILWSISVEEQFYIVWGTWLKITSKIGTKFFQYSIPLVALFFIFISIWYRYNNYQNELKLYFHTFSVAANFGIGILLAYCSAYYSSFTMFFKQMSKRLILFLLLILLLSIACYTIVFSNPITILFERFYFSILFALVIAVLSFSSKLSRVHLVLNYFDYLGKISLGLYFYHAIVITIFSKIMLQYQIAEHAWQVMILNPLIMLTLSILCASISYNYIEKPILAFKNNFYRKTTTAA